MGAVARVGFPGGGTCVKRMVERGTGPPVELCALVGAPFGCLKTEWEYRSGLATAADAPVPAGSVELSQQSQKSMLLPRLRASGARPCTHQLHDILAAQSRRRESCYQDSRPLESCQPREASQYDQHKSCEEIHLVPGPAPTTSCPKYSPKSAGCNRCVSACYPYGHAWKLVMPKLTQKVLVSAQLCPGIMLMLTACVAHQHVK